MARDKSDAIGSLWLLHRAKSAGSAGVGLALGARLGRAGLFLDTCLRQMALGLGPRAVAGELLSGSGGELFTGAAAYRFALEVTTGLRSAVPGETNVFGQFRRAWREHSLRHGHGDLAGLIDMLVDDTRDIRSAHLEGIGGVSYGSLVRRLLAPRADERILIVGAGDLAQSLLPFLRGFSVGLWNHRPAGHSAPALANSERWFAPDEADVAGGWADHVVFTTPADDSHDQLWIGRLATGPVRRLVHLDRRRQQRLPWPAGITSFDLDDLFALATEQARVRGRQLEMARRACKLRAGERARAAAFRQSLRLAATFARAGL